MITAIIYSKDTGQIIKRVTSTPEDLLNEFDQEYEDWLLGTANDALEYVVIDSDGIPTIAPRPTMDICVDKESIAADAIDTATITHIPDGTTVSNGENSMVVTGGTLEYVTDRKGKHILRFECFPYLDKEVVINAL